MPQTALATPVLLMAIEMSNKTWKLAFQGEKKRRFVDIDARDLQALRQAIESARERLRLPGTAMVLSCYEAGRDGFWLHRALLSMGVENLVVDSSSIEVNRRARQRKTDKLDAKKLLKLLVRHAGGEEKVWSIAVVPSIEMEDARRDSRERDRLLKERTQHNNRMRALMITQGVDIKITRRFPEHLEDFRLWDGSELCPRLKKELLREFQRWLLIQDQLAELEGERRLALKETRVAEDPERHSRCLAKVDRLMELRGIGPEGAWKLAHEFLWRDFANRRQVGAAAGLTGTPFDSGKSDREQGISKAGNRAIRGLMVELAWCWLRHQPTSELSQWFKRYIGTGKRSRKVAIVAVARRLLIDLWRYAERGVLPAGALLKSESAA